MAAPPRAHPSPAGATAAEGGLSGLDILILSTQDWDALPTRKHRFARWWAEGGNRVLYVEQQMHWAGWLADLRAEFGRAWSWLKGPREVAPDLWVATLPLVIPFFQMWEPINRLNNAALLPVLRGWLRRLGFEHPVLWTYTPHSADFVGKLGERAAVYECVDDFTAAKGLVDAGAIGRMERRLIRAVDLLSVTHEGLYASKAGDARRAVVVPNGVEAGHMARAADPDLPVAEALADAPHPIVGYLGGINYWIDTPLLARIAREHPDWTVALVGPAALLADMTPFDGLPNVIHTGRVPYEDVPRYVKAFDVCVNPYVLDGVAEHCSPLKLYEYIATGKPVVSVDMPEARQFADLIAIAPDRDAFVGLVEAAVNSPDERAAERMAEAGRHTWRRRFETVSAALADELNT
jgi:glycosyltransferase involved in cell wall biosynthesis